MKTQFLILIILLSGITFAQNEQKSNTKFWISLMAGPSWRIAEDNAQNSVQKEFYKELKSGFSYRLHAMVEVSPTSRVGLNISRFSSGEAQIPIESLFPNDPAAGTGILSENDHIFFIGPMYEYGSLSANKQHYFGVNFALGYMQLKNEIIREGFNTVESKGSNLGLDVGLSYRYFISDKIGFGINLQLPYTTIGEFKANGQTIDIEELTGQREDTSRIDVSAGVSFVL